MMPRVPGGHRNRRRRRLLSAPRFEILPVGDPLAAASYLPPGATVTVTASPRQGLESTVALTEALAEHGFAAVPHLAARQVPDEAELARVLDRLATAGVRDIFVVGGDSPRPAGMFPDGLSLLKAIDTTGVRFEHIGVPSYPEGHPAIDDDTLWAALAGKQPYATYTVTQLCFDPDAITRFVADARGHGITLPVVAGVPGVVSGAKLLRTSLRVGAGDSVRFLRGHRALARRLLFSRSYQLDALLRGLSASAGPVLAGLHIYTFNETAATMRWLEQRRGVPFDDEERTADDNAV